MSVLIKGINMPRNIDESLIFAICDDKAVCISTCSEYEAVEVKPHGRLIDADALLDKKQDYGEGQQKLMLIDPYFVRNAPTIIEAEEE